MPKIDLTPEHRASVVDAVQRYVSDELDHELGRFEAEFFVDFLLDRVGPAIYNAALRDAQAVLQQRVEDLVESLDGLEK